jgi:hypothetical protein
MSGRSDGGGDDADAEDLEALREQTQVDSRAAAEAVDTGLEASILEAIEELEVGERSVNMCTRDERVAAIMHGLEKSGQQNALGEQLREHLGYDSDADIDRSEILRLAIRIGLREAAPDVVDAAQEAQAEYATRGF